MIACLITTMNFTLKRLKENDFNKTYFEPNNKIPGYLTVVENNEIDMSATSSLISMMDTENIAFLTVINFLDITYMVPKRNAKLINLVTQFEIFDCMTISIFLFSFMILIILWYLIEQIRSKTGRKHQTMPDILLIVIQTQNKIGIKNFSLLNNRGILITIVLFSFVISSAYEGFIASRLVNELEAREIDTLEELDQSGLEILNTIEGTFKPTPEDIAKNSILYRLYKKQKSIHYLKAFALSDTKKCLLIRTKMAKVFIIINFDKITGKDLFHIVKEKPFYFHRSFMVPKTSPYRRRMNEILLRSIESGFLILADKDLQMEITQRYVIRSNAGFGEKPRNVVITIEHFKPLLIINGSCLGFSGIIFLLEICYFNMNKK